MDCTCVRYVGTILWVNSGRRIANSLLLHNVKYKCIAVPLFMIFCMKLLLHECRYDMLHRRRFLCEQGARRSHPESVHHSFKKRYTLERSLIPDLVFFCPLCTLYVVFIDAVLRASNFCLCAQPQQDLARTCVVCFGQAVSVNCIL
jgi:hypothetical protein